MDTPTGIVDRISSTYYPLSAEAKEKIASILVRTELKKNTLFRLKGEIQDQMCFIYKGMVRQFYFKNGREITEHFTCEGNFAYCIESIFKNEPSRLVMEALENSDLCLIPYAALVELSHTYRGISDWLRHYLENNLILHQVKADSWRFESARERYERFLREFPTVANRASVNDMASYLLMTPESLSRVRTAVSSASGKKGR